MEPSSHIPETVENGERPVQAVLFLPAPPAGNHFADWYLRRITGVPFLLLNVLHLQKGGVTRLAVYHPGLDEETCERLGRIAEDPRVTLTLDWVTGPASLVALLRSPDCRLLVHGGAVHQHTTVSAALAGELDPATAHRVGFRKVPDARLEQLPGYLNPFTLTGLQECLQGAENSGPAHLAVLAGDPRTWITHPKDFAIQHDRLLRQGGLSNDSLMDRWVTRHASRQLTRWFIDTPVTPNQITILHTLVGVGSAWCFYQGQYAWNVAGGVILLLSAWLDSTDGEVARLRFQKTRFGGQLDIVADNVVHFAVFWGIGMGLYQCTGQVLFKILGGFAVLGSLLCFLLLQADIFNKRTQGSAQARALNARLADQVANRDFIYLLFVMALIHRLDVFIGLTAVGSNVFALYIAWSKYAANRSRKTTNSNSEKVAIDQ